MISKIKTVYPSSLLNPLRLLATYMAKLTAQLAFITLLTIFSSSAQAQALAQPAKQKTLEEIVGLVHQYCGACHSTPPANLVPKKSWPYIVKSMAELAEKKLGEPFIPEEYIRDITAYYYGSSQPELARLPYTRELPSSIAFQPQALGRTTRVPLVINVNAVNLFNKNQLDFLLCDGETDQVVLLSKKDNIWSERVLADIKVPAFTDVVDYDSDGDNDIIVAALGHFPPSSIRAGKLILLRQTKPGIFEKEILLENVGRIAQAKAADLDHDGDLDIAVAIFGGMGIGEVAWLENIGVKKYVHHTLLDASGALNVSIGDINNDGLLDIVSLISQEHEMVVGFINGSKGQFQATLIEKGPHPMIGSTGMSLVDLDQDKDLDILFTNGDSHDLQTDPKPYHGVQWLENTGELTFTAHSIGRFYGAAVAKAGDLDGDGDLDVVVSSWNNYWEDPKRQSLLWFENNGKQKFTRHNIASRPQSIVSVQLADITNDGQLDIIAGVFRMDLLRSVLGENVGISQQDIEKSAIKPRVLLLQNQPLQQK